MLTELVAARQMIRLTASKLDIGDSQATTYCAMAKRFATDAGFQKSATTLAVIRRLRLLEGVPYGTLCARYEGASKPYRTESDYARVIISRRMFMAGALEAAHTVSISTSRQTQG